MHTAEVVPNYKQSNRGFEVREFFAYRGSLSSVAPNVHSRARIQLLEGSIKIGRTERAKSKNARDGEGVGCI